MPRYIVISDHRGEPTSVAAGASFAEALEAYAPDGEERLGCYVVDAADAGAARLATEARFVAYFTAGHASEDFARSIADR